MQHHKYSIQNLENYPSSLSVETDYKHLAEQVRVNPALTCVPLEMMRLSMCGRNAEFGCLSFHLAYSI